MSKSISVWMERSRAAREKLAALDAAAPGARRGRPRSAAEWDYLCSKGVPASRLGPRWEGDGTPPRYPATTSGELSQSSKTPPESADASEAPKGDSKP